MSEERAMTGAERQAAYVQRLKDHGIKRLTVQVPDTRRDEFWEAYDKLRAKWERANLFPS